MQSQPLLAAWFSNPSIATILPCQQVVRSAILWAVQLARGELHMVTMAWWKRQKMNILTIHGYITYAYVRLMWWYDSLKIPTKIPNAPSSMLWIVMVIIDHNGWERLAIVSFVMIDNDMNGELWSIMANSGWYSQFHIPRFISPSLIVKSQPTIY